jgi:uncharacterized protein
MDFEFNPIKSSVNKKKHGIDFTEAQSLWDDPDFIEIPTTASDEPRFVIVGKIAGKYWSAIVTYRGEKTRIISVRRSREKEINIYEGES